MKSIDDKINRVNATMSMENMPLTNANKQQLRDCLTGKTTFKAAKQYLIEKHTRAPQAKSHERYL